ncbi:phosphomethylpyrimidine kinase ThiD [Candidatus Pantoea carbekii]|uniref:hydroxymethylpyrimidine kinase n=1 Tax=Candidatus Pantoea carbekii TaxID=1235990 RepID=U3U9K7_9GAMM|nr:phosphomethylpyrimidine kinase ThiD [Candidatus Pantoea carbekii]BAO00538.1 ThiD protein [Candidatus Pantoea carbekii]
MVAQNTCGVQCIYYIEPNFVKKQLKSVLDDVRIDTLKIGMLAKSNIVEVIAECLTHTHVPFIVLDTVMIAKSGDPLLSLDTIGSIRQLLLPKVSLITPNLLEAALLLEDSVAESETDMLLQGKSLLNLGCKAVLIKGGHLNNAKESPDWLITRNDQKRFSTVRVNTRHTHGTGCTLSAAIAALRPRHDGWISAIAEAKVWLQQALLHAELLEVGKGIGPVHHFYNWW